MNDKHLDNGLYLPKVAGCSTFDERDVGGHTHFVNMPTVSHEMERIRREEDLCSPSGIQIVQRIQHNIETPEPWDIKLWLLDIRV